MQNCSSFDRKGYKILLLNHTLIIVNKEINLWQSVVGSEIKILNRQILWSIDRNFLNFWS